MIQYNLKFGKPISDTQIEYAPMPLLVVTKHHEEKEEELIDEVTGENTGETILHIREWDEKEVKVRPSYEDYRKMGYYPIEDELPVDFDLPNGKHYEAAGWIVADGRLQRVYELVDNTAKPVSVSKAKVEAYIDEIGKTTEFVAWLNGRATYVGGWMRGEDVIEYDPQSNEGDLQSLIAAIGVRSEDVPMLIERVRV